MAPWLFLLCLSSFVLVSLRADDYFWGSCPKVPPVPDFDYEKFTGLWYVIEKFDTTTSCWTFYFYNKNGTKKVIQSRNQIVDPNNPENTAGTIGTFETPYPSTAPGFLHARFSDNIAGVSDYVIYHTDYTSYAGIFKCQKILMGHRLSAVIMSRTPAMSLTTLNQARAKLITYNITLKSFLPVDQSKCKYTPDAFGTLVNISDIPFGFDVSW